MLSRKEIKEIAKTNFKRNYWPCVGWLLLASIIGGGGGVSGSGTNYSGFSGNSTSYNAFDSIPKEILIAILMIIAVISFIAVLVSIFIGTVTTAGAGFFSLQSYRGERASGKDLFLGFKRYTHVLGGMLWMQMWMFFWTLPVSIPIILLIIVFVMLTLTGSTAFVVASMAGLLIILFLISIGGIVLAIFKSLQYAFTHYILLDRPEIKPTQALKLSMEMTKGIKGNLFVLGLSFIGWGLLNVLTIGILGIFYVNPYIHITNAGFYEERKRELFSKEKLPEIEQTDLISA